MTYEITIGGVPYQFRFGLGFLREINKRVQMPVDGVPNLKENSGLKFSVGRLIDGSVEELIDVLMLANKTEDPRLTEHAVAQYIEEEVEDIDALFEQVLGFLRQSNFTGKIVRAMDAQVEEMLANQ